MQLDHANIILYLNLIFELGFGILNTQEGAVHRLLQRLIILSSSSSQT
jgi:hypothetical protein